mgnify:CR=1 FL=1
MSKHTPGPWKCEGGRQIETSSGVFYLAYGHDKFGNPNFRDLCELDQNARLIAAAPDLLAACMRLRRVVASLGIMPHRDTEIAKAFDQSLRAIRSAIGDNCDDCREASKLRAAIRAAEGDQ